MSYELRFDTVFSSPCQLTSPRISTINLLNKVPCFSSCKFLLATEKNERNAEEALFSTKATIVV